MRVKFIKLLIRLFLPHYHLSKNPVKKIKNEKCLCDEPFGDGRIDSSYCPIHNKKNLHHPTGETPALGEAGTFIEILPNGYPIDPCAD